MFLFLWIVLQMHKNPQQLDIQYLKKKKNWSSKLIINWRLDSTENLKCHKQLDDRASLIFYKKSNVSSRFHRQAREKFLVNALTNIFRELTRLTGRNSAWIAVAFFDSEGFVEFLV